MADPKPPAASGDPFDIPALRLAVDAAAFMAGRGSGDGLHHVMKVALREVAKEAQLRVMREVFRKLERITCESHWTAILETQARIEKEGPL